MIMLKLLIEYSSQTEEILMLRRSSLTIYYSIIIDFKILFSTFLLNKNRFFVFLIKHFIVLLVVILECELVKLGKTGNMCLYVRKTYA